jgi:hypothetical protein
VDLGHGGDRRCDGGTFGREPALGAPIR